MNIQSNSISCRYGDTGCAKPGSFSKAWLNSALSPKHMAASPFYSLHPSELLIECSELWDFLAVERSFSKENKEQQVKKARQISSITNYMYDIGIALILIFLFPNNGEGQSKDGFYIGVGLTHSSIGGDFDGVSFVAGGGTVEAMPEIEDAFGIKYIVGFQSYIGAIDFNYNRSEHDGNWEGLEMSTVFETYNLDLKGLLLRDYYSARPFLAIGFGINRLTVEDGSTDGFFVADATFEGYALRIGGGVELSLHDQVSIDVMGLYRWDRYDKVEGLVEGDLPDNIDSHGATYSAEVKFIF